MELLDGKVLSKMLLEKYSKNPKGWGFTISPAKMHGFYDAFVSNPNEAWQLKIDSIFKPSPLILGSSMPADLGRTNSFSPVSFGFRTLNPKIALELFQGLEEPEERQLGQLSLQAILATDPVAPKDGGSYAQGPFVYTNPKMIKLSEDQKLIDDRLSSELHRLLRGKYLSYG